MVTMGKATQSQPGQGLAPGQGRASGQGLAPSHTNTTTVTAAPTTAQKRVASAMITTSMGSTSGTDVMEEEEMMVERLFPHPSLPTSHGQGQGQGLSPHMLNIIPPTKYMRYMQSGLTSRSDAQGAGLAPGLASGPGLGPDVAGGRGVYDSINGNTTTINPSTSTSLSEQYSDQRGVGKGIPQIPRPYHMIPPSVPNQSHVPITPSQRLSQSSASSPVPSSRPSHTDITSNISTTARTIAQALHTIATATVHDSKTHDIGTAGVATVSTPTTPTSSSMTR